jgi:hypothetical protein
MFQSVVAREIVLVILLAVTMAGCGDRQPNSPPDSNPANGVTATGGGAFALSFAINHPRLTKSLVLLCPQLHRWDDSKWLPEASRWTLPFLRRPFLLGLWCEHRT